MEGSGKGSDVPDDPTRLAIVDHDSTADLVSFVIESLKEDRVALIRGVQPDDADIVMCEMASQLGLKDDLELQATFADYLGHRSRIGKYFMTVNKRTEYQHISAHSEGSAASGMHLAALYCQENTTDGGESILMNVDSESTMWPSLREKAMRGKLTKGPLSSHESARARGQYHLNLPADLLRSDDRILQERSTDISGLNILEVLARPEKVYCRILGRDVRPYWDSIDGPDLDSALEFERLLRKWGLLKEPAGGLDSALMDEGASRRVWQSGLDYGQLFKSKILRKLAPGELIIQNNLTWTHATNNWSPDSGTRKVYVAFA
jgi:hypothetical protein